MGNSGVDQLNDWKSKARLSNWTPRHYLLRSHESLSVCPLHSLEMPGSFALPTHPSMLSPLKHPVCWHSPHTTVSPWKSQHKFKGTPVLTLCHLWTSSTNSGVKIYDPFSPRANDLRETCWPTERGKVVEECQRREKPRQKGRKQKEVGWAVSKDLWCITELKKNNYFTSSVKRSLLRDDAVNTSTTETEETFIWRSCVCALIGNEPYTLLSQGAVFKQQQTGM